MLATTMAAVLCVSFASCGDDDDNVVSPKNDGYQQTDILSNQDPEGTVTLNMNNGTKDNFYDLGSICKVRIDEANNFVGYSYQGYMGVPNYPEFVAVGAVKGLSDVKTIPTNVWSKTVAVVPGTGYIVKRNDADFYNRYIRIYVVDYIVDTNGGIIGATIKYQAPFSQTIKLDKSSLTFTSEASSQTVNLTYPTTYSVSEKPDWCTITTNENSIKVSVSENLVLQQYSGRIVLKNLVNTAELKIVQQGSSSPKFESGRGTSSDPYTIKTAQQLQNMNLAKGYYFALVSDIDMSSYLSATGTGWIPIGTKEKPFSGTFNGRNHTISGLWINQPSNNNIGLFGLTTSSPRIENTILKTGNKGITGNINVGGICGYLSGGSIINCSVDGTISGEDYVGGICGGDSYFYSYMYDIGMYYKSTISNCVSKGVISSSGSNRGQILGGNYDSNYPCTITNCSSTATLQDK